MLLDMLKYYIINNEIIHFYLPFCIFVCCYECNYRL